MLVSCYFFKLKLNKYILQEKVKIVIFRLKNHKSVSKTQLDLESLYWLFERPISHKI